MGEAAEVLEVRLVPAVITVNSLADTDTNDPGFLGIIPPGTQSDNVLTFREAVRIVNSGSTFGYSSAEIAQVSTSNGPLGFNDTIQFAPSLTASGPQTISMTDGRYGILRNVTIDGPGTDKLSLDARLQSRVLTVSAGVTATLEGLTLLNGRDATGDGGVIHNSGTLTLEGVTISGGKAGVAGGGIFNNGTLNLNRSTIRNSAAIESGGAIKNRATLNVRASTIENNLALEGGGIFNDAGQVTVNNSTLDSNQALGTLATGGAISNENNGRLNVFNSTISENVATSAGGGIANSGRAFIYNSTFYQNGAENVGGAILNFSNLTLLNATITGNFAGEGPGLYTARLPVAPFAVSSTFNTILSGNLDTSDEPRFSSSQPPQGSNNLINFKVTEIFETENDIPQLADNGGPTKTVALKAGSPAFNAGLRPIDIPNVIQLVSEIPEFAGQSARDELFGSDQRGFARKFGVAVDIGAFEFNQATSLEVTASGPGGSVLTSNEVKLHFRVTNTSNVASENVTFSLAIPDGVDRVDIGGGVSGSIVSGSGGRTARMNPRTILAEDSVLIEVGFTLQQSAAGKTLRFTPVVTTRTFSEPIVPVTLSLPVLALPTLPAFNSISHDAGGNQTSVGRTVSYSLRIPPTMNGGQTAQIDPNTVSAADFKIEGTTQAQIVLTAAGSDVIGLSVTPTGFGGTLSLAFADGAEIKDTFGRTITLAMPSDNSTISVTGPLVVSKAGDEDDGNVVAGELTLREAVRLANGRAGSDTIQFEPGLGTITLTRELALTDTQGTLSIFGPDGGTQVIERSRVANPFRLFQVATGTSAAFRSLTLQNGSAVGNGGAILNLGSLVIDQSTFRFNDASGHGGAIFNGGGTGQSLRLNRSTLWNNTADRGGAIYNDNGRGNSLINGEFNTISGNSSRSHGGGIFNVGQVTLIGSTIVLNRSDSDGVNGGDGGGLAAFNIENLANTIIAGNLRGTGTTPNDIGGGFVDAKENNFVGDGATGGAISNGVNGNIVGNNGSGTLPLASILNPTLDNNGGPTQTHALVPFSPARDAGSLNNIDLFKDQRGFDFVNNPDIGAFEYQPTNADISLTGDTTIFVVAGSTVTVNEKLIGTGNLIKTGLGTLVLKGNNTYSGQTRVLGGTLVVGHNNALGTASGSQGTVVSSGASLAVDPGLTVSEVLTLSGDGFNNTGALRMNPASSSGFVSNWNGNIAVANNTRIDVDASSVLTIFGRITPGTGPTNQGLTKTGNGRLVFTQANTYTGPTVINAGDLAINGAQPQSPVTLNGGTFSGTGTTGAVVATGLVPVVSGSPPVVSGLPTATRLSPNNNGIGRLTTRGNLTLNSSSTFDVQINGTTAGSRLDNVDVKGAVNLNGATLSANFFTTFNFFGIPTTFISTVKNQYQIITNDGSDAVVGTFNGLAEGAFLTIDGQRFQITYKGGTGNDVVLTHVNTNSAFRDRSITALVGENGLVTLQGSIVEVDPQDRFKLTIEWGDGRREVRFFPAGSDGKLVTLTHQYQRGRATPYEVFLKWEDQHGGGNTTRLSVQVVNVAPTATITGPETINVNQLKRFTFQATDPADQGSAMQWVIDWGDGTSESFSRSSTFSRTHKFTEPGEYLIRATATDRDGLTSAITTFRVQVTSPINPASLLGDLLASGQI